MPKTSPEYFVGASKRFSFTITKDGVAWPLQNGYVKVDFFRPDKSRVAVTASATNATSGLFYYDTVAATAAGTTSGDLNQVGEWQLFVEAHDVSIVDYWGPFLFDVQENPQP